MTGPVNDGGSGAPDFQRLFESAPTPYLVLDTDLVVVAVNQAYLTATLNTRESLLRKPLFDAFPDNPDDPAADGVRNLRQSLEAVLATGRSDAMVLQRYDIPSDPRAADGEFVERYWSPMNAPVFSADGVLTHIIHRVEDVTEFVRERGAGRDTEVAAALRKAERMETDLFARAREVQDVNHQLRHANAELARVGEELRFQQQAKDRFIATLSHELRNPLAAAQVAVELLAAGNGEDHPAIGVLQRQLDALVRMTDDLLDATRAQTGRLTVERYVLDLRDVIADAVGDAEPELRDRSVRLLLPEHAVFVEGDRVRLAQVMGNLLSNARKYSGSGASIDVDLTATDTDAELTVRDNGIGFEPSAAEHLFELFSRAAPRPGTDVGGLGIGLAIVRAVVESHGGSVSAASAGHDQGAEFRITLPLAVTRPGALAPPRQSTARPASARCVLIIEDNVDLAETYRRLLEQRGDAVVIAHTGAKGLLRAAEQRFDLVLSDLGLPDIDGWELARRLRLLPQGAHARLVAVSGFGQESDRTRSERAGFDAHIPKPMRLSDLDELWDLWSATEDR